MPSGTLYCRKCGEFNNRKNKKCRKCHKNLQSQKHAGRHHGNTIKTFKWY